MNSGDYIRLIIIAIGSIMMVITVLALSKHKMTEAFSLVWFAISFVIAVMGLVIKPVRWYEFISAKGLVLIFMGCMCLIIGAYYLSRAVSVLIIQNRQLAIEIALLKEQIDELKRE